MTPAVIVGMTAEARIARAGPWPVAVGGGQAAGAEAAARAMLAQGATGLVSLGLAGGLAPGLPAGTVIVPVAIRDGDRVFPTDPTLSARLGGLATDGPAPRGPATDGREAGGPAGCIILGVAHPVATVSARARLWRDTGAVAADMESGAVARVAAAAGVPCAALRVICDPAERDLPPAALLALSAEGRISLARVIASVLRHPGQLPALLRLSADASRARRALAVRVRRVG